jgi:ABC-type branched-subunit amino acid transport system substrate-binding protein
VIRQVAADKRLATALLCAVAISTLPLSPACSSLFVRYTEPPLSYQQAEDSFRLGDYERAAQAYRRFLLGGTNEELVPRAFYKLALAEFRRGRYAECIAALDQLAERYPRDKWPQVYALRGDAEQRRGNTISALHWWELAWAASEGTQKTKLRQRLIETIDQLDPPSLTRAREVLNTPEILSAVDARLAEAGTTASSAVKRPEAPDRPPPADEPIVSGGPVSPTAKIGCLLPLTGAHALYGRRSLNAITLGLGPYADRLVTKDTAGQIHTARAALDELIEDPGIIAVIGPLRSQVAEALAPRAERGRLPTLLLSQREGSAGRYILQPTMTEQRQAAQLVAYAVKALGLSRFGIIHPGDAYGTALADAFRSEVMRHEARVVGTLAYTPGTREFALEVLSVQNWHDQDGLDAVFIPDYAETAIPLATQIRRSMPDLTLLGSNGWHNAALGDAPAELEGVVFVDGFFAASARPATQAFVTAYRNAYDSLPDILEAQAYDAAKLVRRALEAGATSRDDVIPMLQASGRFEGASGTIVVQPNGILRSLFLLRLSRGVIQEIDFRPDQPSIPKFAERALETEVIQ